MSIFSAILFVSHRYLVERLAHAPAWGSPTEEILEVLIWFGAGIQVLLPFAIRSLPPSRARLIAWPGYTWLGTAFYLLFFVAASDIVLWLLSANSIHVQQIRAMSVVGATAVLVTWGMVTALSIPGVKQVQIALPRWPKELSGYRIIQLSDIHIGAILQRGYAERLVELCNRLEPDLIAITGDLVDGSLEHLQHHVAPFEALRARDGVFFVTGNHDHYAGASQWSNFLEELGLRVLRNAHATVQARDSSFVVGGVYDRTSSNGDDVNAAFSGASSSTPRLLLAHHPQTFHKATQHQVDLQLSGHTHAGQLWPFRYFVHLQTPFIDGLHWQGPHALYVSRGTGFWGPPMRILAPPEVTELILVHGG